MTTISLIVVIAFLLAFLAWRDFYWAKQIDSLTSKLMARDYKEYAFFQKDSEQKFNPNVGPKPKADPTLGTNY